MEKKQESIMEMFNLPKYTKGKTFAEASRLINKKFEGQDDKDSQATLRELQERLQGAQEYVKKLSEPDVPASFASVPSGLPETPPAGAVVPTDNPSAPVSESPAPNQFFFGGDAESGTEMTNEQKARQGKTFKSSSRSLAETGLMGDSNNDLLDSQENGPSTGVKLAGAISNINFSDKESSVIAGEAQDNAAVDGVKDGVASVLGPFGQLFRGIQKGGQGLGDAVGGDAGAGVADAFSPEESTIANFKDEDMNIGQKILGTVPILGGIMAKKSKENKIREEKQYQTKAFNYAQSNRYDDGGDLDKPKDYSDIFALKDNALRNNNSSAAHVIKAMNLRGGAKGIAKVGSSGQEAMKANIAASNKKTTTSPTFVEGEEAGAPKSKFNAGALLRYAPAAMNAYQFAKLEKPSDEQYGRINAKYEKDMVDEKSIQNVVGQDVANMRNKILASSGGSASGTRASLLASQLKGTKALSDAYMQAENINRGEDRKAQDFNLNVAKTNLQQSNMETQAKAANEGAYKTQRSKLLAQLGNDLGAVGKEELLKKYPEMMGMDYDERGRYIAKLEAEKKKKKASKKK